MCFLLTVAVQSWSHRRERDIRPWGCICEKVWACLAEMGRVGSGRVVV